MSIKKCAIVTGGASGIGKSIVETLSKEGYEVVVADINEKAGLLVAKEVGGFFVKVDLVEQKSCISLVKKIFKKYGRIDILINNAGFQHISPLEDFPEKKWDEMLSVMLTAPFWLTKYVWPYMKEQKWGRIINMASIHGLVASKNKVGYISAKHGLIGLTRASALEGGEHGITVNALCPAYVKTPLVEGQISDQARIHKISEEKVVEDIMLKSAAIKKIIKPKDVAAIVLLLCSENGASITGSSWTIDGGWTAQ